MASSTSTTRANCFHLRLARIFGAVPQPLDTIANAESKDGLQPTTDGLQPNSDGLQPEEWPQQWPPT